MGLDHEGQYIYKFIILPNYFDAQTYSRCVQSNRIEVAYELHDHEFRHLSVAHPPSSITGSCPWVIVDGWTVDMVASSFKSKESSSISFSFSIIMLWSIIQANMVFSRFPCSYRRVGRRKMQKRDCKIQKAHSTSFLTPYWCSENNLCSPDCGARTAR